MIKRVGWLAAWNPCRPDGYVELSLDRREERQVAKVGASGSGSVHHYCIRSDNSSHVTGFGRNAHRIHSNGDEELSRDPSSHSV